MKRDLLPRPRVFSSLVLLAFLTAAVLIPDPSASQVLGSCGTNSENEPAPKMEGTALGNMPVPLPGHRAINFELPAVVGDEIKNVKLSDFNGKWRVVCFYPADFTFV